MNLFEMKQNRELALKKAEAIVSTAENEKRILTDNEGKDIDAALAEASALVPQIERIEKVNTLRSQFPTGRVIADPANNSADHDDRPAWQTKEYRKAFKAFCQSRGQNVSEALRAGLDEGGGFKFPALGATSYEGGSGSGVPIVPSVVEQSIIALAPPVMGVESIATVIPTSFDIKFPRKSAHGTAAYKAEGTGNGSNLFTGSDPTLQQFTLSAYMIGHPSDASWELLQDVNVFQSYLTEDIMLSLAVLKEAWFVTGTGTNQAQGLIGNTAAGVTGVLVGSDNYASELLTATLDVQGLLNPVYDPNATWLMAKATGIALRKAQMVENLYVQPWTKEGGKDYLWGRPVVYSGSMPAIAATNTPILYGDFKAGYIIGQRGGAGVNVKILDQPKALEGLLTILGYQRVDGRVRRSEAIQAITLHA